MESERRVSDAIAEESVVPGDADLPANILSILEALADTEEESIAVEENTAEQQPEAPIKRGITVEEFHREMEAVHKKSLEWSRCGEDKHCLTLKERQLQCQQLRKNSSGARGLSIVEVFKLNPEEDPQNLIIIGRLSRQLLPEEVFSFRPRWCFYFWRCLTYASDLNFRSFACINCPQRPKLDLEIPIPEKSPAKEATKLPESSEYLEKPVRPCRQRRVKKVFPRRVLANRQNRKSRPVQTPTPTTDKKPGLKLISSKPDERALSEENGKRKGLRLLELMRLRPEESCRIKIKLGRLSRLLWTDEAEAHYNKDCRYFTRCLEFSVAGKFSFTCSFCPLKN